jgi:hypothetical protein
MPEEPESKQSSQALELFKLFQQVGHSFLGLVILEIGWTFVLVLASKLTGEEHGPPAIGGLVVERRREHSRKPDCVRERIERLVAGPYLELFARETKEGWDCWGDQVALFDNGAVPTRRQPTRLVDAPALSL